MTIAASHATGHESVAADRPRYLSYSQVAKYLLCPEQYRLHYVERLRPKVPSASLVFGSAIHAALAHLLRHGEDPLPAFETSWAQAQDAQLRYGAREDWEALRNKGRAMLSVFLAEGVPRITEVLATEQAFELSISSLDRPLVGVLDLVAVVDGMKTVIDHKTSSRSYPAHEVALSDQLSAYQLAVPDAQRLGYLVLLKTKEPRLEWHFRQAHPADGLAFLTKAEIVAQDIAAGRYYKRPGQHCAWCDFRALCVGDEVGATATLEHRPPDEKPEQWRGHAGARV